MKTRDLCNAVIAHLDGITELTGRVGDGEPPSRTPVLPYIIVDLQITTAGLGSLGDMEEDREFIFAVLLVGRSREQCNWASDLVKERMLTVPLSMGSGTGNIQGVSVDSIGRIVRTGDILFQGQDLYRLRAGK